MGNLPLKKLALAGVRLCLYTTASIVDDTKFSTTKTNVAYSSICESPPSFSLKGSSSETMQEFKNVNEITKVCMQIIIVNSFATFYVPSSLGVFFPAFFSSSERLSCY